MYIWKTIVILIIVLVLLCAEMVPSLFDRSDIDAEPKPKGLKWVREESHFVDYQIIDDTVKFRFSFCFENTAEEDIKISPVAAKFWANELKDWVEYEKFFEGRVESNDYYTTIPGESKVNIIFVFTGSYLGGKGNDLSVPMTLFYIEESGDE